MYNVLNWYVSFLLYYMYVHTIPGKSLIIIIVLMYCQNNGQNIINKLSKGPSIWSIEKARIELACGAHH